MTNEERKKIKKKYDELIKLKEGILNLKMKIEKYEKNPAVKEYLKLKEQLETEKEYSYYKYTKLDDNRILEKAINSVKVSNTNNIYVYIGTYKEGDIDSDFNDYIVSYNDSDADFREYISIESASYADDYIKLVPISECDEFEKENIVLYPPKDVKGADYYSKIKTMYFDTAVKYGCDKALEKVLYKRNIQKSFKK